MCEHIGISALTGKRVKGENDSAIKEHLFCNHWSGFDIFSLLASNNNNFKVSLRTLKESLLINRDHPPLNKNRHMVALNLLMIEDNFYHMLAIDWSDCSSLIPHRYCIIK